MYAQEHRNAVLDEVKRLLPSMSLSRAINEAITKHPGPTYSTVWSWTTFLRRPRRARPEEEHFNIYTQAAVDRVFDLVEEKKIPLLAACREVLPTVSDLAWGHKARSVQRLCRWCYGPQGDRYPPLKVDHLPLMQQVEFLHLTENEGVLPSEAY